MVEQMGVRDPMPGVVYAPVDRLERYVSAGELPTISLIEALSTSFAQHRERIAIYSPEGDITYAELDEQTDRIAANLLHLGLTPLDRVLFQSANSAQLLIAVVGCLKAGLIPVCTLAPHREHEIGYLGRHTEAKAHIVQGDDPKFDLVEFACSMREKIPSLEHVISLRGDTREGVVSLDSLLTDPSPISAEKLAAITHDPFQVAIFQLSGGTSGVPKVIPRMQNEYLLLAKRGAEILGFQPDDVLFMPMPMMHNAAMGCIWLPSLLAGSSYVIPADMTPAAWGDVFRRSKPTWVGMIRALFPRFEEMLDKGLGSNDSVRMYWTPDAARLAREKYGKPGIGMFGMTEGMCMYPPLDSPQEAFDWTVGVPLSPFDEVRLVEPGGDKEVGFGEVGEMECRGPYTLCGYYDAEERNAEAFTSDGFYKTGDLMRQRDIDGRAYYEFAGRTRDIVDRGHEKVNCEEIENAVSTHSAISGCAVVGMPDPVLGERVCAYVVLRAGHLAPSVVELGNHLKTFGMAKFKWPERIETIEELPLTKVGKLDKAPLRADITAKLVDETALN